MHRPHTQTPIHTHTFPQAARITTPHFRRPPDAPHPSTTRSPRPRVARERDERHPTTRDCLREQRKRSLVSAVDGGNKSTLNLATRVESFAGQATAPAV